MPLKPSGVVAIIVTYHPDSAILKKLLQIINRQVDAICIVDNSPTHNEAMLRSHTSGNLSYTQLKENMGVAYAQNIGIKFAIQNKAKYALLLDQDSIPDDQMVKKLLKGFFGQTSLQANVIATSPQYVDPRTNYQSRFMGSKFGIPFRYRPNNKLPKKNAIPSNFLISSGTLIDLSKLMKVGGMRSSYFIDHVDTEWCLRATSRGYQLLGVPDAHMIHSLGDEIKKFWFFGMRNVSEHTPLRDYYMFRNTLLMLKDVSMPFPWKFFLLFRLAEFFAFFLVFSKERALRFRLMILGLRHGYNNFRGRLDLKTLKCDSIARTSLDPI